MRKILVIGAGKSATTLIHFLLSNAAAEEWEVTVGDLNIEEAQRKVGRHERGTAITLDISDKEMLEKLIGSHNLVLSMLPAFMHIEVAKLCVTHGRHLITASYVTPEMQTLHDDALKSGTLLLNEIGLDPGIDHMSAMRVLDSLRDSDCIIEGFETFTGGLLSPESELDNPWKYKFTWNPRNVVMAASGGAVKFLHGGKFKYIPYHKVFRRTERIRIDGLGSFDGYANRDSLKYLKLYNLEGVKTLYRGTLRRPGFCKAWDIFVQLGATDDSYIMEDSDNMTHRDFINSFLLYHPTDSVEIKLAQAMKLDMDSDEMFMLEALNIFSNDPVGLDKPSTPAQVLQKILEKIWTLDENDRDMIVMWHKFYYSKNGMKHEIHSTMSVIGDDPVNTAMAKTVGLPMGIAARLVLSGRIKSIGVQIPITKEIYFPVLDELETWGIVCREKHVS